MICWVCIDWHLIHWHLIMWNIVDLYLKQHCFRWHRFGWHLFACYFCLILLELLGLCLFCMFVNGNVCVVTHLYVTHSSGLCLWCIYECLVVLSWVVGICLVFISVLHIFELYFFEIRLLRFIKIIYNFFKTGDVTYDFLREIHSILDNYRGIPFLIWICFSKTVRS